MEEEARIISTEEFAEKLDLEILYRADGVINLTTLNVSRPGLQLTGFFDYFGENRVQVFGNAEMKYYDSLSENDKISRMNNILSKKIPCAIISRSLTVCDTLLNSFTKHNCPLFKSKLETTQLVNNLIIFLNAFLAPSVTLHGVLIDVSGVGVMLTGESGIGKSETALELVKRGHRLIADDLVIVKKVSNTLIGESPEVIKHFMEIRGIGILDVRSMYGVGAVKDRKYVDLVVQMENWNPTKEYNRIDGEGSFEEILGMKVPKMILPITPGRNIPIIIEAAAANFMLKKSGYDAAKVLIDKTTKNANR